MGMLTSLFILTSLLLSLCLCETYVFSEQDLTSSSLWRKTGTRLVLIKKDAAVIPAHYLEYARRNLSEEGSPAKLVEVECPNGERTVEGGVCSLLSQHHVVLRNSGGGEDLVGKTFPFEEYEKETQLLVGILESFAGGSLSQLSDHASLSSFLQSHSEVLVALVPDTSTSEYVFLLASYLVHRPDIPLVIISSAFSLPLSKRPRCSGNPRLHLWNVLHNGSAWYACPGTTASIQHFLVRTSYPEKIVYEKNRGMLKEFKKKRVTHALFFRPLPEAGPFDFDQLIEKVTSQVYSLYVIVTVDRTISRKLAKHHFVSESSPKGHIVALPYGIDEHAVGMDIEGGEVREEYGYIVETLLEIYKDSQVLSSLKVGLSGDSEGVSDEDGQAPTISITDFSAMAIAIEHFKTDLVFVFCKQGAADCPDEMYIMLEKAHRAVLQAQLNTSINFFVVECHSVENVQQYNLDELPSYAIYDRTKKTMVPGTGDVRVYRDILFQISEVTGIKELGTVQPVQTDIQKGADDILKEFALKEENDEHDVYGRIAATLTPKSLPKELILTSENFAERIAMYGRTAVMFYMNWSVKSRVALQHLTTAYNRLDKKDSVTLGSVACDLFTDLCTHYNVTVYPSVLIFTPSSLSSPAPLPPSIGVTDSVHLLKALSDEHEPENVLMEVSPATLPVILKKSIQTSLVLWCDTSRPTSYLGAVFADVVTSDTSKVIAYGWMNCKKYGHILEDVLEVQRGSGCGNVFGFQLHKHMMHQLDKSAMQLESAGFREALLNFIQQLKEGSLTPTKVLPTTDWLPVEPPVHFPSTGPETDDHEGSYEMANEFPPQNGGKMDLSKSKEPESSRQEGTATGNQNTPHHLGDEL